MLPKASHTIFLRLYLLLFLLPGIASAEKPTQELLDASFMAPSNIRPLTDRVIRRQHSLRLSNTLLLAQVDSGEELDFDFSDYGELEIEETDTSPPVEPMPTTDEGEAVEAVYPEIEDGSDATDVNESPSITQDDESEADVSPNTTNDNEVPVFDLDEGVVEEDPIYWDDTDSDAIQPSGDTELPVVEDFVQEPLPEPDLIETTDDIEEPILEVDDIEVIGEPVRIITPLPGVDLDKSQITTNIQTATGDDIQESRAINASQFMNEQLQSVTVNDYTGNPFRQDVNFRGFSASPLIATPQGLSVYVDGVRVNEAFGDVVNWDLIPLNAVENLALVPGANPLFGLNTLGGAVSVNTKSGFTAEGINTQILAGSWGREQAQFSGGYNNGNFALFGAFNGINEDGWRDNSPSRVRQGFARADYQNDFGQLTFSTMYADNTLVGNGTVPQEDIRSNLEQVYTSPDIANNELLQFQLTGRFDITPRQSLTMMAYRRDANQAVSNGDFWDDWDGAAARLTPCDFVTPIDGVLVGGTGPGTPDCLPNGVFGNSLLEQDMYGFSFQWTFASEKNQLVVGATYDANDTSFTQSERLGYIEDDRSVVLDPNRLINTAIGPLTGVDFHALSALEVDIVRNLLEGTSSTLAFFFLDVWQIHPRVNLSFGARYSRTEVENELQSDLEIPLYQFTPGFLAAREERCGAPDDVGARFQCTEEAFTYKALNPAVGISIEPIDDINVFANLSKGTRNPSAVELSCARSGEDDPVTGKFEGCTIPTALTNDPFLPKVRAVSREVGVRGENLFGINWNAALFRTDLKDDILFTSLGFGNRGVFDTFGKTRRQGIELGFSKPQGRFRWFANYTFLEATFESQATVVNLSNSSSSKAQGVPNTFNIEPGDVIPGFPENTLRLGFDVDITPKLTMGLNVIAQSETFVRGNENNEHQPVGSDSDGPGGLVRDRDYVGDGSLPGFAILNLDSSYFFTDRFSVFLRVENVLDKVHFTAGNLGLNAFTSSVNGVRDGAGFNHNSNDWTNSTFVVPGGRRAGWVGINYSF